MLNSGVSDFIDICFHPRRVFARVRKQGIWVAAFLAVVFLGTLPTVMVIGTAGIELLTLQRYQHDPILAEKIGGDPGIEREVSSSNDRWTKMLVVSRVAGTQALVLAILAGVFMRAVALFDDQPGYFVMLGTLSYSVFPFALLGAIISLIMLLSGLDQSSMDLENMPALNLGRFLDRDSTNVVVYAMASEMDVLLAGQILWMTIGLGRVTKLSIIQGLSICGSLWALAVLWKATWLMYM
jgi:hypothetical protein